MNKKPLILIVDDEPFNVDYLEQELEDLNYETITAVNGQDALEKIASDSPDLVLLDIMMPIMDGYAVLEKVKADPAIRDIPIIVISAIMTCSAWSRGSSSAQKIIFPNHLSPLCWQLVSNPASIGSVCMTCKAFIPKVSNARWTSRVIFKRNSYPHNCPMWLAGT
jgi:CheY-like chemotaxis protein